MQGKETRLKIFELTAAFPEEFLNCSYLTFFNRPLKQKYRHLVDESITLQLIYKSASPAKH